MNDLVEFIKDFCRVPEAKLEKVLIKYVKELYDTVYVREHSYILAEGDIPVCLVAHLDTVGRFPPQDFFFDKDKGVLWSPDGVSGFDDRAGVVAILKILQKGLKPSILFTCGEETGGLGAKALVNDFPHSPINNLKLLIEVDREGYDEVVFYTTGTQEFIDFICSFGFQLNVGTFSDISVISPIWKLCSCNVSAGYFYQHSASEHLYVHSLERTIDKLNELLVHDIPMFKYEKKVSNPYMDYLQIYTNTCHFCKKEVDQIELFPIEGLQGEVEFCCSNCLTTSKRIGWCSKCDNGFEITAPGQELCYSCLKEGANLIDRL